MIEFINLDKSEPYKKFLYFYQKAIENGQDGIEVVNISSYNLLQNEVHSRFVNLKYVRSEEWIFFSNYNSLKSEDFKSHDQICATFFWSKINTQIRINAKIFKSDSVISDNHFNKREASKNALAVSSYQSKKIKSYDDVKKNYNETLKTNDLTLKRPEYWGGFSFVPYYFEFWEGHNDRINKRQAYQLNNNRIWSKYYLQP